MTNPESPSPVGWYRQSSFFGRPVPAFAHAHVADVMRAGLLSCGPETRLRGVAQAMAANHVHALVVIDPGSDDLTVGFDATAAEAADLMHTQNTRHLIVLDEDGHPGGVVSSLDLTATLAWGVGPPAGASE